jgi:hypothetical protein
LGCALYIRCAVSIHHKGCGKVWGARYTLGARYLPKNTVYSKVCIGKHLSDDFPIQNGLKQGDPLLLLLLNFSLQYAIRKVCEDQVGVKLNGTHQL